MKSMKTRLDIVTLLTFVMALGQSGSVQANDRDQGQIVDLSLIVAENYPCTWATGFPRFYMNRYIRIGPSSPYNSDLLQIDGNTGGFEADMDRDIEYERSAAAVPAPREPARGLVQREQRRQQLLHARQARERTARQQKP